MSKKSSGAVSPLVVEVGVLPEGSDATQAAIADLFRGLVRLTIDALQEEAAQDDAT